MTCSGCIAVRNGICHEDEHRSGSKSYQASLLDGEWGFRFFLVVSVLSRAIIALRFARCWTPALLTCSVLHEHPCIVRKVVTMMQKMPVPQRASLDQCQPRVLRQGFFARGVASIGCALSRCHLALSVSAQEVLSKLCQRQMLCGETRVRHKEDAKCTMHHLGECSLRCHRASVLNPLAASHCSNLDVRCQCCFPVGWWTKFHASHVRRCTCRLLFSNTTQ